MHILIISCDTSCNGLSDVYSTRNIPWIGKKGGSKNLLDLERSMKQCCFCGFGPEQLFFSACNGEWLSCSSSTTFRKSSDQICHGWALMKTEWRMNFQSGFNGSKSFQELARWWRDQGLLEHFEALSKKFKMAKMQMGENVCFLIVAAVL